MQLLKLVLACFLQTFRCAAPCDHLYWNDGKIGMMEKWNGGRMELSKTERQATAWRNIDSTK